MTRFDQDEEESALFVASDSQRVARLIHASTAAKAREGARGRQGREARAGAHRGGPVRDREGGLAVRQDGRVVLRDGDGVEEEVCVDLRGHARETSQRSGAPRGMRA